MKNRYEVVTKLPKFNKKKPIFIDIEADVRGNKLKEFKIKTLQVLQSKVCYILDYDEIGDKIFEEAKKIRKFEIVAHRSIIDFAYTKLLPKVTHDTYFIARELFPELTSKGGYGLDNVFKYITGRKDYEKLNKKAIRLTFNRGEKLTKEQLEYASLDCFACKEIWKLRDKKSKVYKLNTDMLKTSLHISNNGLLVDLLLAQKELDKLKNEIDRNYIILNGVNPNSPKQVFEAIGKDTGKTIVENVQRIRGGKKVWLDIEFKVKKYKGYKFIKTDKTTLLHLIGLGNKLAKAVYDQRRLLKAKNMLETYMSNPIDKKISKVISYLYPLGTYTNRYSGTGLDLYNGINAQQITRKYQYLFHQPYKDTVVIHADYSTAEVRLASMIMNEKHLAQILREGVDVHKYTASVILDKPLNEVTKDERQKAKSVVFGFLFGMSAKTFVEYAYTNYNVIFTLEEATTIRDKFFATYPALEKYHKHIWNTYKNTEQISPLGLKGKPKLGTDAINYSVQAGIGETTKLAVRYMTKKHPEALKYLFNIVHDAIYMRVPRKEVVKWAYILHKSMSKGWDILQEEAVQGLFKLGDIPMPIEVEVGHSAIETTNSKEVKKWAKNL